MVRQTLSCFLNFTKTSWPKIICNHLSNLFTTYNVEKYNLKVPNPLYSLIFLMSFACHSYDIRMSFVCPSYVMVCHSYLLVFHPYVTTMYSYVMHMLLVCTGMSSVCHYYVLVCHPSVTCMYWYVISMSLICAFTMYLY